MNITEALEQGVVEISPHITCETIVSDGTTLFMSQKMFDRIKNSKEEIEVSVVYVGPLLNTAVSNPKILNNFYKNR